MSPRKEVLAEGVELWLGDCLRVLPCVEAADHCITDPPFEAEAHTLQRRVKRGGTCENESLPFEQITTDQRFAVAAEIARLCSGWGLAFCQAEAVPDWREAFEEAGASYKRAMVWIKPDGMPQYSGDRPGMGYESIVAAWCGGGRSKWRGGGRHGVFTVNKNEGTGPAPHPTTKPQRLMQELVELFTDAGDVVLDPFMGSGSTGIACVRLGRKFIGIEKNPDYFDIACRRVEKAVSQPSLFIERPAPAKQEGLAL